MDIFIDLGAVLLKKKAKFYFVCPVTLSVPRDSNGQPIGYDLDLERGWVEKVRPALIVSLRVLQMAAVVARLGITATIVDDDGRDFYKSFADQDFFKSVAKKVNDRKDDDALLDPLGELDKGALRNLARSYIESQGL